MNNTEVKKVFIEAYKANLLRVKEGERATTIGLIGNPGISKTSTLKQIFEDLNQGDMELIPILMAGYGNEVGDLLGNPVTEYLVEDANGEQFYMPKELINPSHRYLNKMRKVTAKPEWVEKAEENHKKGLITIVLLDDFLRGQQMAGNAVMELLESGSYADWQVPNSVMFWITANYDDNSNNETSLDKAQKRRMVLFEVTKVNIRSWANYHADGLHTSLLYFVENEWPAISPILEEDVATLTKFCYLINHKINDLLGAEKAQREDIIFYIFNIGKSTIGEKATSLFIESFVNNIMTKLCNVEDLIRKNNISKLIERLNIDCELGIVAQNIQISSAINCCNQLDNFELLVQLFKEVKWRPNIVSNFGRVVLNNHKYLKLTNKNNNLRVELLKLVGDLN